MLPDLLIDIYDDALVCRMRIACLSAKAFNCQLDTYKDGKQKKSCRNNKHDEDTIIEKEKVLDSMSNSIISWVDSASMITFGTSRVYIEHTQKWKKFQFYMNPNGRLALKIRECLNNDRGNVFYKLMNISCKMLHIKWFVS